MADWVLSFSISAEENVQYIVRFGVFPQAVIAYFGHTGGAGNGIIQPAEAVNQSQFQCAGTAPYAALPYAVDIAHFFFRAPGHFLFESKISGIYAVLQPQPLCRR